MDNFCVICNMDKDNAAEAAVSVRDYILGKGKKCEVVKNQLVTHEDVTYYTDESSISDSTDCIIVLGGDGTMIQAANDLVNKDIPMYGINIGNVGFLTESNLESMEEDIDKLIEGKFRIENRIMLKGKVINDDIIHESYALNEFVMSKRDFGKLISFEVYVNNELLDSFLADGIIISTPTGSTGYNLSAGGPVISPEMDALAVTPVCPHSLNDRSIVISGESKLMIKLNEGKNQEIDEAMVNADGKVLTGIKSGDKLYVEKAKSDTDIILMEKTSFYHRMRSKLN